MQDAADNNQNRNPEVVYVPLPHDLPSKPLPQTAPPALMPPAGVSAPTGTGDDPTEGVLVPPPPVIGGGSLFGFGGSWFGGGSSSALMGGSSSVGFSPTRAFLPGKMGALAEMQPESSGEMQAFVKWWKAAGKPDLPFSGAPFSGVPHFSGVGYAGSSVLGSSFVPFSGRHSREGGACGSSSGGTTAQIPGYWSIEGAAGEDAGHVRIWSALLERMHYLMQHLGRALEERVSKNDKSALLGSAGDKEQGTPTMRNFFLPIPTGEVVHAVFNIGLRKLANDLAMVQCRHGNGLIYQVFGKFVRKKV